MTTKIAPKYARKSLCMARMWRAHPHVRRAQPRMLAGLAHAKNNFWGGSPLPPYTLTPRADRVPTRDAAAARGVQPTRVAAQEASNGAARGGTKREYTWAPGRIAHAQHAELASSFKPSPNFYAPLRGPGTKPDVPPPV